MIQIIVNKYADHDASKEDIPNIKLINMLFNQSSLIRIIKALEFTTSTFAKATLDQLNKQSPLALAITFELFKRA